MRAWEVNVFDRPLERAERATPQPVGTEVLIEMTAAGVCHSDLHICEGHYDLGGGKKLTLGDRGVKLPLTMGHEIAGVIVAAGPDSPPVEIGGTRVVYPWIGCGTCPVCARGDENLCAKPRFLGVFRGGGYATHVIVPHAKYLFETGGLSAQEAAPYACSGLTTFSALKKIDPAVLRDEPILLIGAGGLGLMCLSLLRALGAKGAFVADIDAGKREAAMAAGALAVVDPKAPDVMAQLRAASGLPGFSVVIDLVGAGSTLELGVAVAGKGGKVIVVGLIGGEARIAVPVLPQKALIIQGSYVGNPAELADLMHLVATGKVDRIPTSVRPLDEVNAALEDLRRGRVLGRIVLAP